MTRLRRATRKTFVALSVRNYRLYFTGQVISVSGTWMQMVAQTYLILFILHGTGVDVAIATGLQFLPMLFFGTFGGLIADRVDKRKMLYATQGSAAVLALAFGLLVVTGSAQLTYVYVLAGLLGVVNLFDNPARQTFVPEMVGLDLLPNAVSLNSVVMNGARVIGPGIGGVLILTLGVSTCFMVNAASYVAVLVALTLMRTSELHPTRAVARAKGQVREGLRYVWATPDLRNPLLSMAVVGVFAFNFTVTLPLLAKFTFNGGAGLYSAFLAAMGIGAVGGGLKMNAGAMGAQTFDQVVRVRYLDREGIAHEKTPAELEVHYRHVPALDENFAVSAVFRGEKSSAAEIVRRLEASQEKRRTTQPSAKSAGCIFKNPAACPAGKLVDELGLKGSRVGDARVSEVHGNFIVNEGAATADEVLQLIGQIQATARQKRGIELETEVQIVGEAG